MREAFLVFLKRSRLTSKRKLQLITLIHLELHVLYCRIFRPAHARSTNIYAIQITGRVPHIDLKYPHSCSITFSRWKEDYSILDTSTFYHILVPVRNFAIHSQAAFLISMRLNTFTLTAHLLLLIPFATCETNANDYGVLDWIHNSDGGFVNPKQEFRHEDPDDPTSPVGMFAKERIEADEVLMKVPWDLMLKSDDMTETGQMCCGTVKALTRELAGVNRGSFFSSSPFAPYIRYLDAQPDGVLPSDWSRVGQRLLRKITGGHVKNPMIPPTEPTEWLIYDWRGGCLRGGTSTPLQNKAALLVVQKSDDPLMVPGGDLYVIAFA